MLIPSALSALTPFKKKEKKEFDRAIGDPTPQVPTPYFPRGGALNFLLS